MSKPAGAASPLLRHKRSGSNGRGVVGYYDSVNVNNNEEVLSDAGSSESEFEHHGTTPVEAFLNLLKGYFGAGMLSLPWALSQLGVFYGSLAVFTMALWSSYNCWTVVKLKRFIERTQNYAANGNTITANPDTGSIHSGMNNNLETASGASSKTNLTFPDVGEWAYGTKFQSYVSACVCTQQLAICTVFISFIGENVLAVLDRISASGFVDTHVGVMTLCLPCVLSLSFLPSMKRLAPVMAMGTILLGVCVAVIGVIMGKEWDSRPDELPSLKPPKMPLAACAILYSYEGICLILPVESSMREPKHFKKVFVGTMTLVAACLAAFASINVYIFGNVTNGSITAFLLEAYRDDPSITFYVMAANTAISLSVLLSYPLQLFPALELIGNTNFARWLGGFDKVDDEDEESLSGFEPLPPLPEHDVAEHDVDALPSEHHYGMENPEEDEDEAKSIISKSTIKSMTSAIFPTMIMTGDSPQLRAFLVFSTYLIAVAVPNVQALISLVGALAGSSTALLIPPILELAWVHTLEEHRHHDTPASAPPEEVTSLTSPPSSPFRDRRAVEKKKFVWIGGKYWASKIKSYILFVLGVVFAIIGTYASLMDIVRIYAHGEDTPS